MCAHAMTGGNLGKYLLMKGVVNVPSCWRAGPLGKFPWPSLPADLQERIMSNLTVHETAVFTCAVRSRNARVIHHNMMRKRHEALRDILRKHLGKKAARLMPPLDMANPGDVYVDSQVVPLPGRSASFCFAAIWWRSRHFR